MSDSISIDPAEAVLAVLGELKRQRTEGLRHLYLEDSTIEGLELLLGKEEKETENRNCTARNLASSSTKHRGASCKTKPPSNQPKVFTPPAISLPQERAGRTFCGTGR
jgi:hypothetical protein